MGIFKDAKASTIGAEAKKAADNGQAVFATLMNSPSSHHGMSGEINDWSLMIQAIEAEGWRLSEWSVGADTKGRPQAYPLFRRG